MNDMRLRRDDMAKERPGIWSFVQDHWLLAFAIHPLMRFFILAEPQAEMNFMQIFERFHWLSWWATEVVIIFAASRKGFRLLPSLYEFSPAVRVLVAVWLMALAVSTLTSQFLDLAIQSALQWLIHGVFVLAVWHLVQCDLPRFGRLFDQFVRLGPPIIAITGMLGLIFVYRIGLSSDYPFLLELPGFVHIRHTGYMIMPAMALCIGQIASAPHSSRMPMFFLAINSALCLWFGSRGPFFALFVGMAIAFVLFRSFRRPKFIMRTAVALFGGAITSVVVPSPDNNAFNVIRRLFESSADPDQFSSGRIEFWKETASLILRQPLFGHGGGQFQFVSTVAEGMYRHPHNFVLQFLFDWGVVGGGAFLALLAAAVLAILRRECDDARQIGSFAASCMIALAAIDGILFYPYTTMLTIVLLLAAIASRANVVKKGTNAAEHPQLPQSVCA